MAATADLLSGVAELVKSRVPPADLDERDPDYIRESLPRLWLLASLYFRAEVRGLGNVPEEGPVLLVGNHSGGNLTPDTGVFTLAFSTYFGVERAFIPTGPQPRPSGGARALVPRASTGRWPHQRESAPQGRFRRVQAVPLGGGLMSLIDVEREGWEALSSGRGAAYYREHLTDDALMAFSFGVMTRDAAIEAMESAPPWESYEMKDARVVELTEDSGVVVYAVEARRAGQEPYSAVVSSTFVRRDGEWKLAFHQQTPA